MAVVVLIDQQQAGMKDGQLADMQGRLNEQLEALLDRPFERAVGDQVIGIIASPSPLSQLLLAIDEADGAWTTSIGIGELDSLGDSARQSSGPAMRAAKAAAERSRRSAHGVAVEGATEFAQDIDSAAVLVCDILASRSARQREVVKLRRRGHTGEQIAQALDISRRAVHKHLTAARYALELEGRSLVDRLSSRATV